MLFCSVRIHCWCKLIMAGREMVLVPEYTCIFLLSRCPVKTADSSDKSQKFDSFSTLRQAEKKTSLNNEMISVKMDLNSLEMWHLCSQSIQCLLAFHIREEEVRKRSLAPLQTPEAEIKVTFIMIRNLTSMDTFIKSYLFFGDKRCRRGLESINAWICSCLSFCSLDDLWRFLHSRSIFPL